MNEKGFTLVEMMVAVTILAIGLLATASLQVSAIRTNAQAASVAEATALAQSAMERIAALPGDHALFNLPEQVDSEFADLQDIVADSDYLLTVKTDVDYNAVANVTRVDVTLESVNALQTAGANAKRTVTLTALKRYF